MPEENQRRSQQNEKQQHSKEDEPSSRHALFIAHRPQSLHTASRQQVHELCVSSCRWTLKMVSDAVEQRGQVIFANPKVIKIFRRGRLIRIEWLLIHSLENGFARNRSFGFWLF